MTTDENIELIRNAFLDGLKADMRLFQAAVGSWADTTFNKSTLETIINHLKREIVELEQSKTPDEAADCFLLLLHFAHKSKFNLFGEARKKHDINMNRKWGEPDREGVVEHIEKDSN